MIKFFLNFNTSPCVAVPGCRWQKLSHEEASDMFFFVYDSEKIISGFYFSCFSRYYICKPVRKTCLLTV